MRSALLSQISFDIVSKRDFFQLLESIYDECYHAILSEIASVLRKVSSPQPFFFSQSKNGKVQAPLFEKKSVVLSATCDGMNDDTAKPSASPLAPS